MSNDLVTYDEKWGQEASEAVSQEPLYSGGRYISTMGGVFRIGDMEFPELCAIVLASTLENSWYGRAFNSADIVPPKCFAVENAGVPMAPHEATQGSEWFEPQADKCADCIRNAWPKPNEIDPTTGQLKRKECRTRRRLLLLPAGQYSPRKGSRDLDLDLFITDDIDETIEYVASGDLFLLKIPPSALSPYKKLIHALKSEYNRPPHGVILRLYMEPLRTGGHTVNFEPLGVLPAELYPAIYERRESEKDLLLRPYSEPRDDDNPF